MILDYQLESNFCLINNYSVKSSTARKLLIVLTQINFCIKARRLSTTYDNFSLTELIKYRLKLTRKKTVLHPHNWIN